MLSNFDIEEIAHHFNIRVVIVMKDELKNIHPTSYQNYVINLQSSTIGNGTHWMALKIKNKECVYFDSYGNFPLLTFVFMSKRFEKLDDLLYKGIEESIFKKIRNAIEKNPHVIADKS